MLVILVFASFIVANVVGRLATAVNPEARPAAGERIRHQDVDIRFETDGAMLVTESIEYDFGAAARHGIKRDIPVREPYLGDRKRLYPLEVLSVEGPSGTPTPYAAEERRGVLRLKIGDPARLTTGVQTYRFSYRVEGALNAFADHDELYWDAIGDRSPVPVERASVRVTAPARISRAACFAGTATSRVACQSATSAGTVATFSHGHLDRTNALTVAVAFPTGAVPVPLPVLADRPPLGWAVDAYATGASEWVQRAFALTPFTVGATSALTILVLTAFGVMLWRVGRDRRHTGSAVDAAFGGSNGDARVPLWGNGPVPVEFVPPDGLRPAQLGLLVDERADIRDITATIVDLARRGYLRIEEVSANGNGAVKDWKLVKQRDPDGLAAYEHLLFVALFKRRARVGEVKVSELKKRFGSPLKRVREALYSDAVRQGWFPKRPDLIRDRWRRRGVAVLAAGLVVMIAAATLTEFGLLAVPVVLAGFLLWLGACWMPRRTPQGNAVAMRTRGFQRFIEGSEAPRAEYAAKHHLFTEYLAYAIVFGSVKQWVKAFDGLDTIPRPEWYSSTHPFNLIDFSLSFDRFASSTSSTLGTAAASRSSGWSSSGGSGFADGFAGGGAGGGSTTSW